MATRTTILVCIGAASILAGLAANNFAAVREAAVAAEVPNIRGDLKVTVELTSGNGNTSTEQIDTCSQIDFHPEYVVLREKTGGRVVPMRLMRQMHWQNK